MRRRAAIRPAARMQLRPAAALARLHELAFDAISVGACVLDSQGRLELVNEEFLSIYRLSREDVRSGMPLRDILDKAVRSGALTPSAVGRFCRAFTAKLTRQKSFKAQTQVSGRAMSVTCSVIGEGRWLAVYHDLSAKRRLELQLQTQVQCLNYTLANMSHGLCLFGPDERLIMRNEQYCQIYGLDPAVVTPGTSHRQIIEHWVACGNQPGMTAEQLYEKRMREIRSDTVKVGRLIRWDGRIIEAVSRTTPEGGWVSTNEDITERCRTEARMLHMARHDALTNLPNRVLFRERMAEALADVAEGDASAWVLLIDLDNFKEINDRLGHASGDNLLEIVSERLVRCVRSNDTVARLGGDEFAVLLRGSKPEAVARLASRIIRRVSQQVVLAGRQVVPGVSIGIARAPQDGTTQDALVRSADDALYRSKGAGRGTYRFFDRDMDHSLRARFAPR